MEETRKKSSSSKSEPADKSVTVSIGSKLSVLTGVWQWDMQSDALYCSDVMAFPPGFEGTKSIVHPDDLTNVKGAVDLLADGVIEHLDFRVITTYGEVKNVGGKNVSLEAPAAAEEAGDGAERWDEALRELALRKEAEYLNRRKDLADSAEKIFGIGSWALNKTTGEAWYSDGMYRLHGLPPQSLNTHAATFNPFIHPDDRLTVLDALEKAYADEVPVHLEYAILLADGTRRHVRQVTQWSFNGHGQSLFSGIVRDLSGEQALTETAQASDSSLRLYQQIFRFGEQHWNTGYWILNLVTRKTTYSENYYRIYGLKGTQLPDSNAFLNLVHPDDRLRLRMLIQDMYQQHVMPETEYRIIRPDGRQRYLKQSGKLIPGQIDLMMVGIVQDVSVLRGLEKKIGELNDKAALEEVVKSLAEGLTGTGVVVWYPEDGGVLWSEGVYRLLGYKPDAVEASSRLLHKQIHSEDLKRFKDAEALAVNGQPQPDHYFRVVNKAGVRELRIHFSRAVAGSRDVVIGIVTEVSKENLLHRKLSGMTAYAEKLADTVADMAIVTDADNNVLQWNTTAAQKTGIKKDEALYANFFDLFPELRDERFMSHLKTAWEGIEIKEPKARARYVPKPHRYTLTPVRDGGEEVKSVLHLVQDISKELELQQQLAERLNFIESLVEASVDRIVVLNRHMNYLYWNKKAEDYYAIRKEKVIGKNILEVFPSLRNDPSYAEFRRVLRGETVYLPPASTESGKEYFETYLIPVADESGEPAAVLWIVHDLRNEKQLQREREKARRRLAEEHRRLKEAQAIGHVGSFEWTVGAGDVQWSDELYRINGMEPGDKAATFEKSNELIHPDDREETMRVKEASIQTPGRYGLVHRIVKDDGEVRWVSQEWESIAGEDGTVKKVTGIVQDITKSKNAEAEAKQQQELLQATTDSTPDMIQVFRAVRDERGGIVDFSYILLNHAAEKRMPGALGKSLLQEQPGVVPEGIFQAFKDVVETGVPQRYEKHYVHEQFDGWFYQSVVKLGDGVATTTADITGRKQAERQILHLKDEVAKKATDKYESLFNSIDEGFCIIEVIFNKKGKAVDYRFCETNPAFDKQTGLHDVKGKTIKELRPQHEDFWYEAYGEVAKTGEPKRFQYYASQLEGGIWFEVYAFGVDDPEQHRVAVVFNDITERKHRERQQGYLLKLSDALRTVNNSLEIQSTATRILGEYLQADCVFYTEMTADAATTVISNNYVREGVPKFLGSVDVTAFGDATVQLRAGETVVLTDVITDEFSETVKAAYAENDLVAAVAVPLVKTGKWVATLVTHSRTPRVWTAIEKKLVEETAERTWAAVEKAKAEEALRASQNSFRSIANLVPDLLWDSEPDGSTNWYNQRWWEYTGQRLEQAIGWGWTDVIHPDDREGSAKRYGDAVEAGRPLQQEYRIRRYDGEYRWFVVSAVPFRDENGRVVKMYGAATDIHDRKQAEEALRRSEEKYRSLFTSIDEGFYQCEVIFDEAGKAVDILYLTENPAAVRMVGQSFAGKRLRQISPLHEEYWYEVWGEVALTGISARQERYSQADGKWFDVFLSKVAGKDRQVAVIFQDVTERKKAEDALRQSEGRYRSLTEASAIVWILDGEGRAVSEMPEWGAFTGMSYDQYKDFGYAEATHPDDRAAVTERWAAAVAERKPLEHQFRLRHHGGGYRRVSVRAVPVLGPNGEVREWVGTVADVQDKYKAEEALQQSEEKYRTLFNSIDEGFQIYELLYDDAGKAVDFRYLETNPAYERQTGLKNVAGKLASDVIPNLEPYWFEYFDEILKSSLPLHAENYHQATGRWYSITSFRAFNDGRPIIAALFTDVTERKAAEEKLKDFNQHLEKEVEERTTEIKKNLSILKQTEDIAAIGSWEYQIPSGRFSWSDGMYRIFDFPMGAPVQPEAYIHSAIKEDKPAARRIARYIKSGSRNFEETVRIKRADGDVRQLKVKGSVVKDEAGRAQKVIGVDLDITDIKAAEEKIKEQSQYAQTIIDASVDQITVFDKDYRFIAWNRRSEEAGGLKKEDVIGKSVFEIFPSVRDDAEFMAAQEKAMSGELVYIPAKRGVYTTGYQEWFYVPLKNEGGETYAVLNIIHDISARIKAEEQLQQKARELEAKNEEITNFAFIASHDLKEPIRKIHTFSNWLMEREADGLSVKGKEFAFKINNAVKRLETLIEDITTLTKLQAIKTAPAGVNLSAVLAEAEAELGEMIKDAGAVVESKSLPAITGDRKQLVHLFRNVISNAIKFQQPGVVPVIEITCAKKSAPESLPHREGYELKFTDNGIGFGMEYAEKIFRVFQRLHGQADHPGTGIGLAICKKIMENHGGDIKAQSAPGKGSVFTCYFPAPAV